ncbi:unnamed protein product [Arctogadus glacialis]
MNNNGIFRNILPLPFVINVGRRLGNVHRNFAGSRFSDHAALLSVFQAWRGRPLLSLSSVLKSLPATEGPWRAAQSHQITAETCRPNWLVHQCGRAEPDPQPEDPQTPSLKTPSPPAPSLKTPRPPDRRPPDPQTPSLKTPRPPDPQPEDPQPPAPSLKTPSLKTPRPPAPQPEDPQTPSLKTPRPPAPQTPR